MNKRALSRSQGLLPRALSKIPPSSPSSAASASQFRLTHLDPVSGRVRMVDVGEKERTERRAVAEGSITMTPETFRTLVEGRVAKGDAFSAARIAGIQAAKRTPDWIPLCHPIALTHLSVDFDPDPSSFSVHVRGEARAVDRTGVEMEALVAVAAALLCLYDMLKAIDRGMVLSDICLLEKEGGRSGHWHRESLPIPTSGIPDSGDSRL